MAVKKKIEETFKDETEAVTDIVKVKKHLAPADPAQIKTKPGDNTKMVNKLLVLYNRPKVTTDEECEEAIAWYFKWCAESDTKPSVSGLACAVGTDRQTLWDWETGRKLSGTGRCDIIKRAKLMLNMYLEEMSQNGKVNPAIAIFLLKNHFGYRDVQDVNITPVVPLGTDKTADQIMADLPDDVLKADFKDVSDT